MADAAGEPDRREVLVDARRGRAHAELGARDRDPRRRFGDHFLRPNSRSRVADASWQPMHFATRPALVLSALLGSGAAGLSGLWLGIRTGFDAVIFARWARDAASGRLDLGAFDAAMVRRGLMPAAKAGRNIDARIAGATGLLRRHALMLAIQIGLLTLALVLLILLS